MSRQLSSLSPSGDIFLHHMHRGESNSVQTIIKVKLLVQRSHHYIFNRNVKHICKSHLKTFGNESVTDDPVNFTGFGNQLL